MPNLQDQPKIQEATISQQYLGMVTNFLASIALQPIKTNPDIQTFKTLKPEPDFYPLAEEEVRQDPAAIALPRQVNFLQTDGGVMIPGTKFIIAASDAIAVRAGDVPTGICSLDNVKEIITGRLINAGHFITIPRLKELSFNAGNDRVIVIDQDQEIVLANIKKTDGRINIEFKLDSEVIIFVELISPEGEVKYLSITNTGKLDQTAFLSIPELTVYNPKFLFVKQRPDTEKVAA
jgi:hypothetical protein